MRLVDEEGVSFPDGIQVTFECVLGYTSSGGSPGILCTAGSWSQLTLVCESEYFFCSMFIIGFVDGRIADQHIQVCYIGTKCIRRV